MKLFKNPLFLCILVPFISLLLSCGGEGDSYSDAHTYAAYGQSERNIYPSCFVLEGENSVNIRTTPYLHSGKKRNTRQDNIAFQLNPGDTIFVSSAPKTITNDGVTWYELAINDTLLYGSQKYIKAVPNANFESQDEALNVVMLSGLINSIPVFSPWILLILTLIIFACSFAVYAEDKESLIGEVRDSSGMRPIFVFSSRPYRFVLTLALRLAVSIVIAVLAFLVIGGLVWALLWATNILMWIIIIIGWILLLGGIIACFCGAILPGGIAAVIGGIVVYFKDSMFSFGESCVATGKAFFEALNMFGFVWGLVEKYWQEALLVCFTPLIIFLAIALAVMIIAGTLILIEKVTTSYYNIKHPCPFCHNPSEPAKYLSCLKELPIQLRPGIYGLLHVTHPDTGERMPTTLLNGRDALKRKCPHCDRIISYETGVEKHFAFVGLPESGKTCLTYRFIGNLMRKHPDIDFTDDVNNEAKKIISDIKAGKEQDLASKTSVANMRRSIQILVPGQSSMPYHFFINDVGGELFTDSGVESKYVQFFKDVESIALLVDPFTMDFSDYEIGSEFKAWYDANVKGKDIAAMSGKLSNVLQTVKSMSDQFVHKSDKIHMNIVLVKADAGYVSKDVSKNESELREFVTNQLGLTAEISDMERTYASLHFYAVSALKDEGIDKFTEGLFDELKIKLS